MLTSSSRQIHSTPRRVERFVSFGSAALGLALAALASSASCGAPQAEAGPSRVQGVAGSAPTIAPLSQSVDTKAGRIAVSGALAPQVIRGVMREQFGRFRACYESLPQPRPVVSSDLNFTIGAAGDVTAGHVDSEASPALGQCLERVVLALHFPAPKAGDVTVEYPVQFGP
jgi:hypothetical protein